MCPAMAARRDRKGGTGANFVAELFHGIDSAGFAVGGAEVDILLPPTFVGGHDSSIAPLVIYFLTSSDCRIAPKGVLSLSRYCCPAFACLQSVPVSGSSLIREDFSIADYAARFPIEKFPTTGRPFVMIVPAELNPFGPMPCGILVSFVLMKIVC